MKLVNPDSGVVFIGFICKVQYNLGCIQDMQEDNWTILLNLAVLALSTCVQFLPCSWIECISVNSGFCSLKLTSNKWGSFLFKIGFLNSSIVLKHCFSLVALHDAKVLCVVISANSKFAIVYSSSGLFFRLVSEKCNLFLLTVILLLRHRFFLSFCFLMWWWWNTEDYCWSWGFHCS